MAITNSQIAALPDYTDAELLKLVRKAIAEIMMYGSAQGAGGRQLTRASLEQLRLSEADLQQRVNATGDPEGGIVLARFGDAQ
jgi:hypothetical protein